MRKLATAFLAHHTLLLKVSVVLGVVAATVFWGATTVNALHDAAWVNSHVRWTSPAAGSARPTVVDWEEECTAEFNRNRASMPDNTAAQQRAIVNASAYYQEVWLTRRGDPRNISNTPVNAGAAVNMQVNDLVFLCAIITMPASGFRIDPSHRVTNSAYPNDRAPVPDSSASQYRVNQASRYESNSRIYGVDVVSGPGTITNKPIGQILGYNRDNNSRYWNAPAVPFTYVSPNNLPSGTYRVVIEFDYATIQTYHAYGSDGVSRCRLRSTGEGANVPYNAFSRCERRTERYAFNFTINQPIPPAGVFPSSTVDKPNNKMAYPDTATFRHYVNASGYGGIPGSTGWRIQRYRNGAPIDAVATGTYTVNANGQFLVGGNRPFNATAADAGDRICERLQLVSPNNVVISTTRPNPSEVCVDVVARPYMTVTNNDVWAGGRFDLANNKCVGQAARLSEINSWVMGANGAVGEYGVMALGPVTDFGSGRSPSGMGLTFANTPSKGSLGASTRCIPDYYTQVGTAGATNLPNAVILNLLPGGPGKRKYVINGNAIILGGTLPNNMQATILVNGNVRIVGDINYDDNYTDATNIASLGVIARGNIYVQEDVQNLSGLFITQNKLHTCVRSGQTVTYNPLTTSTCANGLTIYGSIIADQVLWQRTRGTVGPAQPYAESVQFDPGLYLTSPFSGGSTTGNVDIEDTKELPPIY